ncbi:MAG: RtcB family protein [Bacteroidia bacterium]|nr:RtcB family protein [Bacteroidia bacterium]MDW8347163.1 RtcB family protein [Bacteroidia bacterium]
MKVSKFQNHDFKKIGLENLADIQFAGRVAKQILNTTQIEPNKILNSMRSVLENPELYVEDALYAQWAKYVIEKGLKDSLKQNTEVRQIPLEYQIYGRENIETGAITQMDNAMRLPISVAGALMPDAHHGYGLPIGGVLATQPNYVIPFAVGVDIACRMCLSVYDVPQNRLNDVPRLKKILEENTRFGLEGVFEKVLDDPIFERKEWKELTILRKLKDRAYRQIGSSGTGNHFVEFGILEITEFHQELKLPPGKYMALLSHSGSRGLGANIANHYSKIAQNECKFLPKDLIHLAWLDLNKTAGAEYWIAMNFAGEYASACHHHIHKRIAKALGEQPVTRIENHHNFAWKEHLADGTEVIVHRKGATPAGKGVLGVIPGSMTAKGYVVRGKGNASAIYSASHGAGRIMSRTYAINNITHAELKKHLDKHGVVLIGGGLDEAPMAYKNIDVIMQNQSDLVDILATFTPKVVRMAEPENPTWIKKKGEDIWGE